MRQVNWNPGNGSLYLLLVSEGGEMDVHRFGNHPVSIIWVNPLVGPMRGGVFSLDNYLHYTYLQEKMQVVSSADTAALLAFLQSTGIQVGMPPNYNKEGKYEYSKAITI